jgi:ATP-dependent DNA helicase RecQ
LLPPAEALDSFESVPVSAHEQRELTDAAQRLFGYPGLLPGQAQIMTCTLRGEDVLAVLPTGGGKSLCYQLPAFIAPSGTTLVISPLIALMKDQVDKLPSEVRGLATSINSSLQGDELTRRLEGVKTGRYRLVYAAPERLRQPSFLHALRRAGLNRLVIDEVHCVSMWGHDFRPDYLYIAEARKALGNPALLSMTATAAPRVREDILQRLGRMRVIAGDVMRANLRLEVLQAHSMDEKLRFLLSFCRDETGAGIVYASSRVRCEELAELLRSQGVSAIHYHAGMENRAEAQDEFMSGRARVVVATVAFGMGIDKPDIRFILHYEPPASLEAYYQEAGRAGRDGLPARCLLM